MARRKKLPDRLFADEVAALLKQPNPRWPTGARNRALIRLFYRSGLRCAEALALTPRDINYERREIRVNKGKGGKDRVVWVDEATIEILARWRDRRPTRSRFFFCTLDGGQVDPSYVRAMIARYGRKAGIRIRCHPHLLRHTFATELLEDGYTIAEVMKLMGHARIDTTETYLHVTDERLAERLRQRE